MKDVFKEEDFTEEDAKYMMKVATGDDSESINFDQFKQIMLEPPK